MGLEMPVLHKLSIDMGLHINRMAFEMTNSPSQSRLQLNPVESKL